MILPGLGRAIGEPGRGDRFKVSAETRDPGVLAARREMFRAFYRAHALEPLRARVHGVVSTAELHRAYLAGGLPAAAKLAAERETPALAVLVERFLVERAPAASREKYRLQLGRYLETLPPGATAADVTTATVARFLAGLSGAASTRNRYRAAIGAFATWAILDGALAEHPIRGKRLPGMSEPPPRLPTVRPAELAAYVRAMHREGPTWGLVAETLLATGADVGELLASPVGAWTLEGPAPRVRFLRPKTKLFERTVPIPAALAAALAAHRDALGLERTAPLFAGVRVRPLQLAHARARASAKVPDLRLKDLRHLFAMAYARAGVPLGRIRRLLGHATINQTMTYADFAPDAEDDAHAAEHAAALRLAPVRPAHYTTPARTNGSSGAAPTRIPDA